MNHGHVTPNPDGVKARCGGPAICSTCKEEALALPRAEIVFRRSQLPDQRGFPVRYTITGRWDGAPNAVVEIASGVWTEEHLALLEGHWGLYPIKMLTHSVLFLAHQNQDTPLVVRCVQEREGWVPRMEVVDASEEMPRAEVLAPTEGAPC